MDGNRGGMTTHFGPESRAVSLDEIKGTRRMSDNQQVDLSQQANVTLPLFQWNAVLGLLRTGRGEAFTWEQTNPLILAINQQLQQQMYAQQSRPVIGARPNGEDTSESRAKDREDDARVQRRRPPLWEQNRAEGEE